ncbi:ribosomal subunit interface protein [Candidatus Uhrbacteria bacterium CG_4_9_14_3_um_filter_36_7]|uniref:Ribosomal subunit interface protein n=1 Tax=Candidatus Uhrbacteria bacterium CG_4_9_14_3_um_filter_36_7 TaxID=1975033 RepID=A0A2M7XEP5_9BACT|nr:MAG: ribosomal subunit interface protein [Candidatus Uhrbacteria bacterium CG_4_9_14_3_um_filter_36_7]
MNISSIQSTNIELTDAIRSYVEQKVFLLEKLLTDFEASAKLTVEVGKTTQHHYKGEVFRAEMNLDIPGEFFRAEEIREDLYEAIDAAKDNLKRQLSDYKDRLTHQNQHIKRPGKE